MMRFLILTAVVLAGSAAHGHNATSDPRAGYTVAGYSCEDVRAGIALLGGYAAALAYLEGRHAVPDARKLAEIRRRCKIGR